MFTYDDRALTLLLSGFSKVTGLLWDTLREETQPEADFLVERVKENVPVKTGYLRDHVSVKAKRNGILKYEVIADAPYAVEVHERPPIDDHDPDGSTPEGGRGRKYLTRVLDFHHQRLQNSGKRASAKILRQLVKG